METQTPISNYQKYPNLVPTVHNTRLAAVSMIIPKKCKNKQIFHVVLDEVGGKKMGEDGETSNNEEPTLKTRSLPAWVRSKPRPLSTEDDLNDLYAKVSDAPSLWMIFLHFFAGQF